MYYLHTRWFSKHQLKSLNEDLKPFSCLSVVFWRGVTLFPLCEWCHAWCGGWCLGRQWCNLLVWAHFVINLLWTQKQSTFNTRIVHKLHHVASRGQQSQKRTSEWGKAGNDNQKKNISEICEDVKEGNGISHIAIGGIFKYFIPLPTPQGHAVLVPLFFLVSVDHATHTHMIQNYYIAHLHQQSQFFITPCDLLKRSWKHSETWECFVCMMQKIWAVASWFLPQQNKRLSINSQNF